MFADYEMITDLIAEFPTAEVYRNGLRDMYNPNCIEYLPGVVSPRSTYDPAY